MKENKSIALKGNGGITLIALVITIIVLIILAGISIAMISGQDGILNKAGKGAAANQLGAAKDKCSMLATEAVNDVYENVYVKKTGSKTEINELTDQEIRSKILDAKSEIGTILGKADGLEVKLGANVLASSSDTNNTKTTGGTIKLTYSDGKYITGTIASGIITWDNNIKE